MPTCCPSTCGDLTISERPAARDDQRPATTSDPRETCDLPTCDRARRRRQQVAATTCSALWRPCCDQHASGQHSAAGRHGSLPGVRFCKLSLTKDNLTATLREWNKPPPTVSPRFTRPCTGRLPRGLCRVLGRFPLRVPPPASKSPRSMIPLAACSVPFGFRCPLPNEVFFRDLGGAFSCDSS